MLDIRLFFFLTSGKNIECGWLVEFLLKNAYFYILIDSFNMGAFRLVLPTLRGRYTWRQPVSHFHPGKGIIDLTERNEWGNCKSGAARRTDFQFQFWSADRNFLIAQTWSCDFRIWISGFKPSVQPTWTYPTYCWALERELSILWLGVNITMTRIIP